MLYHDIVIGEALPVWLQLWLLLTMVSLMWL